MPTSTAEILKAELVEEIANQARERVEASEGATEEDAPAAAELFVRQSYDTIAPDDLLARTAEDLLCAALSLWRFGREREPGKAQIRIYNPTREEHGWDSPFTVVEVINDDMPFLVDSTTAALNGRDHAVQLVLHPVVGVQRDGEHLRRAMVRDRRAEGYDGESYMQVEVERIFDRAEMEATRDELQVVYRDVRAAVRDWGAMRRQIHTIVEGWEADPPPVDRDEIAEAGRFLEWLEDDHFTFLGYREMDLETKDGNTYLRLVPGSALGIFKDRETEQSHRLRPLTEKMAAFARRPKLLFVTKANPRATVHRPSHMDYIGVKRFGEDGRVIGESRFLGLFTSVAYNRRARKIPLLGRKVDLTLQRAGFPPDSHDGKALLHILENFPRDELFQISERRLYEIAMGVLQLQERQRIALFVRRDPFERFVSCLVYVPRDRYGTSLRLEMQDILEEAFEGDVTAYYTEVSDSPLARVRYIVRTEPGEVPPFDVKHIETRLAEAARSWSDRLYEAMVVRADVSDEKDAERRGRLFRKYGEAFPTFYRERFTVDDAVFDAEKIEEVLATGRLGMHLYRPAGAAEHELRFKLYHPENPVPLSVALRRLENMGVRVVSELPIEVRGEGATVVHIHDFGLETRGTAAVDLEAIEHIFPQAFERVWIGEVENDGFNRLVVAAGLAWHEVVVLRAYAKFLRQARSAFSQAYMQDTLVHSPRFSRLLVDLFTVRFDPDRQEGADEAMTEVQRRIREALGAVKTLDEDRILRRFLNLVRHTVRTNHFQRTPEGERKPYLSLKIASGGVKVLPRPRPLYEIFVYSPRTEAVHLRGGKVARGGVRWSDRKEDFRTEILGLMKAQMVKNAVIVPVGAKGGFVVKRPPAGGDREAFLREGISCYETMIRAMLDITDNLVEGRVAPPPRVVRKDDDDPYLVVAADKGTATFSDVANRIAAEYDFWLGDAFASGGSAGYDHKAMGITARGAWVAVERHFRELGVDVRNEDFTVVGVGDMSGDVFGNGMLLSRHTRLVGAFNHLHVFVDPDPDPETSFAERQRLFRLPRSTWADYHRDAISEGGGVFDRDAKAVELSPQIQKLLGLKEGSVPPNRLVEGLLTAQVDLLWFGGIGTFAKASTETDAQVGDRANDAVRVDAERLRCRVVGEGANLGITQRGRVEYALHGGPGGGGGKINTDAIDNSGGVDTSDHEVNIKIALGKAMVLGELALEERNELLGRMTDEVASLVLRDNYLQTQALSIAEYQGTRLLDAQQRMMRQLERAGSLSRQLEELPDDEAVAERMAAGQALTRPEIAVLLAYSKIALYDHVLDSPLLDDPLLSKDLFLYFPEPLQHDFPDVIRRHRLRREIIATYITNSMVNRVGPTFVSDITAETGTGPADVARAYTVAREAYDLRALWLDVEDLDYQVDAEVQMRMMMAVGRVVERVTLWFLRNTEPPLDISPCTDEFRPAVETLYENLEDLLPRRELKDLARRERSYAKQGVPKRVAHRVAALPVLAAACDVWSIARGDRRGVEEVGRIYFVLGDRFGIDWLREAAAKLSADGRWQKGAVTAVVDDLFEHQGDLTRQVLEVSDRDAGARRAIDLWVRGRQAGVRRTEEVLRELRASKSVDLAMLMVADDQLRRLVEEGRGGRQPDRD